MNIKTKIRKIVKEIDKKLPIAMFYTFSMSPKEKILFEKEIKNSLVYLEFGMGGSTFRVLHKSKAIVYAIDSSTEWISLMREYKQIKNMERKGRLSLFHIDIGPIGEWGKPINNDHKEKFPNYSSDIFNLVDKESIDTVLIDGRFRVACALKTIMECYQNEKLKVLIHDFWNRDQYQVLLKYFDVIDQVDSLGVFRIKDKIDLNSVMLDYELFKNFVD